MHRNVALRIAGLWMLLSFSAGHLTEPQTVDIVDMHNDLRSQVQPSAAFMQNVVWDETLRLVAESYAAKCIWDHNPELESLKLGENLFVTSGPLNVTKAALDWFEEHHDYDYTNNSCTENKMCGHYTQMVWADSRKVGCAAHLCDTLEGLEFEKATLLVCNYYPQGNFHGQRPYESGTSCSKCPEELPMCEGNICVKLFPSEEPETDVTQHPGVSSDPSTVPPHTAQKTTNSIPVTGEPTQIQLTIVKKVRESVVISRGSDRERTLANLLLIVWLLAALIL